jgi:transposase
MARPKVNIDEVTLMHAEEALKNLKNSKLAIQLKVIIAAGRYPVVDVSEIFQISPRTIFRWVSKFKQNGIFCLKDKQKGHLKSKLNMENKKQIEQWILTGKNSQSEKIHWTLVKLKAEVFEVFKVQISTTALWNNLRKMKLVIKKPRSLHQKADKKEQESFKKN